MIYGTCYFTSITRAEIYYKSQCFDDPKTVVRQKIANGEIHIGKPPLKPGETCQPDRDGRYIITTQEATKP